MSNELSDNEERIEIPQEVFQFLFNIDKILKELPIAVNDLNVFELLKLERSELRHSNMLAWLLNPKEKHGLGDSFLYGLLSLYFSKLDSVPDGFKILLNREYKIRVLREYKNIDILVLNKAPDCRFLMAIENKIGSSEHESGKTGKKQTYAYEDILNEDEDLKDYRQILIYLTPDSGDYPESDEWVRITYDEILDLLEKVCEQNKEAMLPKSRSLISDYIDVLRKNVIKEDPKIIEMCDDIYQRYGKAIDFIVNNRTDVVSETTKSFVELLSKNENVIVDSANTRTMVRFRTNRMDSFIGLADDKTGPWKTESYYYYEFKVISSINDEGNEICVFYPKFVFGNYNLSDAVKKQMETIAKKAGKDLKSFKGWSWKTIHTLKKRETDTTRDDWREDIKNKFNDVVTAFLKWEDDLL